MSLSSLLFRVFPFNNLLRGMIVTCCCLPVQATEILDIPEVMQLSGVTEQLRTLSNEIQPAVQQAVERCSDSTESALPEDLSDRYSANALISRANDYLKHNLDDKTLAKTSSWLNSNHGQTIINAESNAATWGTKEFDANIDALPLSESWNQNRRQLISRVITQTAAHHYVASLNASNNELQQLLNECADGLTSDNFVAAKNRIENERALLAMFIRLDLVLPTGAVFVDVPDETLNALVQFGASPTGRRFHQVLIRVFEQVLLTP